MNLELESLVVCQFDGCKMVYQNPVSLTCGNSLCQLHLEKLANDQFECYFCKSIHKIPENGLSVNKTVNQLVQYYNEINPLRREIKESFTKLNDIINEHEKLDPEGYIFDNVGEVINRVDLHREELIKEINEKYDEIIKQLKNKKQDCQLNVSKLEKINFEKIKSTDLPLWNHTFRKPGLKQEELNELLVKMNETLSFVQNETTKYKKDLLMASNHVHY